MMLPESLDRRVTDAERREITRVLRKRFPHTQWLSSVASFVAFWGWMYIFNLGLGVLERSNLVDRVSGALWGLGSWLLLFLGIGIALLLAVFFGHYGERYLRRRVVRRHLAQGLCLYCGYCLRGLATKKSFCTCPECGKESPVTAADLQDAPA